MYRYAAKRILLTIPTLAIASGLVFFFVRLLPGDPALLVVGDIQDEQVLQEVRRSLGLDRPIFIQYLIWIKNILSLDFGVSISSGAPVFETIMSRFGVTAQLVLIAIMLALVIAVPVGLIAAWKHNSAIDHGVMIAAILMLSVPSFWVALMLILVFGVKLGWLPTVGYVSPAADFLAGLSYLIMPVVALALVVLGQLTRMMRSTAIDVLGREYVTHARAKGLSEARVLRGHVLKNAFAPTLTVTGMIVGSLLGGAAVIETIFTLPGVGRLLVDSIYARDYPVIQGSVLIVGAAYVLVNLIVDLLYPFLDPRVRLQ
ncbi:MAG: ABC transporter permease [Sphingomonadales bacterium]|nr:ABC transporter permease [Sphingomonadales bacterium]